MAVSMLAPHIVLLLLVGISEAQVSLFPRCSNPQGVYVAEEGSSVEVCFTLPSANVNENFALPSSVVFVPENSSNSGNQAISNTDYVNQTVTVSVGPADQDIIELCANVQLMRDTVIERTEYFTVYLRRRLRFRNLASCEVAITDSNGGPAECYGIAATLASVRLSQIISDPVFCFMQNSSQPRNGVCRLESNFAFSDCSRWSRATANSLTVAEGASRFLPQVSMASRTCVQRVNDIMESLYRVEDGVVGQHPPNQQCVTNCVLIMRGSSVCEASALLLEEVYRFEAMEVLSDLLAANDSRDLCSVDLTCCGLSEPLSPVCIQSSTVVTGAADLSEDNKAVIIGAAVGAVVGLIIVGGAVVAISVLLAVCFVYLAKKREKNFTPETTLTHSRSVIYKRKTGDTQSNGSVGGALDAPLVNPIYDNNKNPPDYEIVASTEVGKSVPYARWRRLFTGMVISPNNLRYEGMIGEGAFGKVHQGILKTPTPGRGAKYITQRDVAVKMLKKASKAAEVEDFLAESAIMLDFNHPNVLRVVGVCFDTQDKLPVIVLPFMANRDLHGFLKSKRRRTSSNSSQRETIPEGLTEAVLMSMSMDIACGMAYLAQRKFVHRDLAARNCLVDCKLSVKVADFGLSRDVYHSDYYRLTHKQRLPIRWMPPESIYNRIYNEKSDVWSYGVVCWEVFTLGREPYSEMENADIPNYISQGHRLKRPHLCPDNLYELMMKTWREAPEERPTFSRIVEQLAEITGSKKAQYIDEHTYFAVEDLTNSCSHKSEQRDIGGVHVYTEVESPVYKEFSSRPTTLVPPSVPEEYEVPIKTAGNTPLSCDNDRELVAIPTEYEIPLSSPRSGDHDRNLTTSSESGRQQLQVSGHVYHTLEPQRK